MRNLEIIRTFKTKNWTVTARAVEDFDFDLSFDDTGEIRKQLETGELQSFGVVVTVCFQGVEMGEDSLWGCIYKSPREFMDHVGIKALSRKDGRNYGSYFSDMVRQSIADARKTCATIKAAKIREIARLIS